MTDNIADRSCDPMAHGIGSPRRTRLHSIAGDTKRPEDNSSVKTTGPALSRLVWSLASVVSTEWGVQESSMQTPQCIMVGAPLKRWTFTLLRFNTMGMWMKQLRNTSFAAPLLGFAIQCLDPSLSYHGTVLASAEFKSHWRARPARSTINAAGDCSESAAAISSQAMPNTSELIVTNDTRNLMLKVKYLCSHCTFAERLMTRHAGLSSR